MFYHNHLDTEDLIKNGFIKDDGLLGQRLYQMAFTYNQSIENLEKNYFENQSQNEYSINYHTFQIQRRELVKEMTDFYNTKERNDKHLESQKILTQVESASMTALRFLDLDQKLYAFSALTSPNETYFSMANDAKKYAHLPIQNVNAALKLLYAMPPSPTMIAFLYDAKKLAREKIYDQFDKDFLVDKTSNDAKKIMSQREKIWVTMNSEQRSQLSTKYVKALLGVQDNLWRSNFRGTSQSWLGLAKKYMIVVIAKSTEPEYRREENSPNLVTDEFFLVPQRLPRAKQFKEALDDLDNVNNQILQKHLAEFYANDTINKDHPLYNDCKLQAFGLMSPSIINFASNGFSRNLKQLDLDEWVQRYHQGHDPSFLVDSNNPKSRFLMLGMSQNSLKKSLEDKDLGDIYIKNLASKTLRNYLLQIDQTGDIAAYKNEVKNAYRNHSKTKEGG